MAIEDLGQRFCHVLEQVEALRHLGRLRRTVSGTVGIGFRAIPRDHRNAGVCLEPLRARVALAVREQGDGLAAFQSNEDGAIGLAFAQGEIVHPQHAGRGERWGRLPTQQAQQRIATHRQVPGVAEAHPRLAPQRHTERDEALGEPQRAPRPGGGHGGDPFGKDAATAGAIAAKPFAHPQLEAHAILRPGQIRQGAPIVTMDAPRRGGAQRTGGAGLRRLHAQGHLRRGVVDVTRLKAQERGIR